MFHLIISILLVFFIQLQVLANDKEISNPLLEELESYKSKEIPDSENIKEITLAEALSIALNNHPKLSASVSSIEAAKGNVLQSSLYINPQISFGVENFLGLQSLSGVSEGEFTFQASQQIILGGKLENKNELALAQLSLQKSNNKIIFLDLYSEIKNRYIALLASQEYLKLTKQLLDISGKMLKTIKKKADSGKISAIEVNRANIIYTTSEIEYKKALLELAQKSKVLSTAIGINTSDTLRGKSNLFNLKPLPELDKVLEKVFQNQDLDNMNKKIEVQEKTITLAESKAIQDITINSGIRYLNGNRDYGFIVGISYPIAAFNRNQGNIISASNNLQKIIKEKDSFLLNLKLQIMQYHLQLSKTYTELDSLKSIVIPEAQKTFLAINKGYQYGKFAYLDVLDAQRTLFSFNSRYIQLITVFHQGIISLERIIGETLIYLEPNRVEAKEEIN